MQWENKLQTAYSAAKAILMICSKIKAMHMIHLWLASKRKDPFIVCSRIQVVRTSAFTRITEGKVIKRWQKEMFSHLFSWRTGTECWLCADNKQEWRLFQSNYSIINHCSCHTGMEALVDSRNLWVFIWLLSFYLDSSFLCQLRLWYACDKTVLYGLSLSPFLQLGIWDRRQGSCPRPIKKPTPESYGWL